MMQTCVKYEKRMTKKIVKCENAKSVTSVINKKTIKTATMNYCSFTCRELQLRRNYAIEFIVRFLTIERRAKYTFFY